MAREETAEKMAQAVLADGGGMRFALTTGSGHTLTLDVSAEEGGDDAGPTPMEAVVAALAGCVGMDVLSILRKKRQVVTGYALQVRGAQAEEHPRVYREITVEHLVTGRRVDPAAVARAIELSATKYCPVGAMLGQTATITHTFQIREGEAGS